MLGFPSNSVSNQPISLKSLLTTNTIKSAAPVRINCGGTWDIRSLALPYSKIFPSTVNIALAHYVTASLLPHQDGRVKVSSEGFLNEEYSLNSAPFDSPLGLFFAIATYFRFHGVHIKITTETPPKSGLGGSGATAVAAIHAFSRVESLLGRGSLTRPEIAQLAQAIEESIGTSLTGMQDQLAATYGGVNRWIWIHKPFAKNYKRIVLLGRKAHKKLEHHIAVAFTGISHESSAVNRELIKGFIKGLTREKWMEIHNLTNTMAGALTRFDWQVAARALARETEIRYELVPQFLTEKAQELTLAAKEEGCGARPAGAGAGGCIWAIGPSYNISQLKARWSRILDKSAGKLLNVSIDHRGVHSVDDG